MYSFITWKFIFKTIQSPDHISEETSLRQFKKAKDELIDLARDAGYASDKLSYLLSLCPNNDDEKDPVNFDSDEVKNLLIIF